MPTVINALNCNRTQRVLATVVIPPLEFMILSLARQGSVMNYLCAAFVASELRNTFRSVIGTSLG